jgi:RimJ/RimL family protein N-acetyltransferase
MSNPYWPLFDLRITTSDVELRLATDEDLVSLARLAAQGIHDPATMPFLIPWTDQPSPTMERELLRWGWRHRSEWEPNRWTFNAAVVVEGEVVGVQDMAADDFATLRTVNTGSWLGHAHQGKGIGKAMRHAIVHLAFAGINAQMAYSGGFADNVSSLRVSKSLGYEENGRLVALRRNQPAELIKLRLLRSTWERSDRPEVHIDGLDACLDFFIGTPKSFHP